MTAAQREVETLRDDVDHALADAQLELDVRIAPRSSGSMRAITVRAMSIGSATRSTPFGCAPDSRALSVAALSSSSAREQRSK